jgi:hypothetical protein
MKANTILTRRRFSTWWQYARKWFKMEHDAIKELLEESASESSRVSAHLYGADENINADDLFAYTTSDGYVKAPSNIVTKDGYIKKNEFELLTGMTFV